MRKSHFFKLFFRSAPFFWYKKGLTNTIISYALCPFSLIYFIIISLRQLCYSCGFLHTHNFSVPIIVVGNIVAGGTGKTPLVIWLAKFLTAHGYHVGIVSRGYGRKTHGSLVLNADLATAGNVGDEAILFYTQTACPVVVGEDRVAAVAKLLECAPSCNVIISDDGLQHYALGRALEIAVIDAVRKFGNGLLLPAGPLRERCSRLNHVDFQVMNLSAVSEDVLTQKYTMRLLPEGFFRVCDLADKKENIKDNYIAVNEALTVWGQKKAVIYAHAVAGIGNPERFFRELRALGLQIEEHSFPDHYDYSVDDFTFASDDNVLLIMTEKDAVKCSDFAARYNKMNWWFLRVNAVVNSAFESDLLVKLIKQ